MTAITRALEFVCTVKYNEVTTLYCQNDVNQIGLSASHLRPAEGTQAAGGDALPTIQFVTDGRGNLKPLGIITKSHPTLDTQGFQRIQDYALQQQSAKLLHGKSRVCFCGKRKIDKNRNRSVVYNPNTERAYFENVQRCGSIWDCKVCAKKITETRRKN